MCHITLFKTLSTYDKPKRALLLMGTALKNSSIKARCAKEVITRTQPLHTAINYN